MGVTVDWLTLRYVTLDKATCVGSFISYICRINHFSALWLRWSVHLQNEERVTLGGSLRFFVAPVS